jgi:uncharacterized protein
MRLAEIEERHRVKILLAVESGSRAWGFPSADSNYDVRFIYVRSLSSYLSFKQPRDVIEQPIGGDLLDINGWDLRKAIALSLKSNATVAEWLTSPISYHREEDAARVLLRFLGKVFSPRHYAFHYFALARKQWKDRAVGKPEVRDKHYCYIMRSMLALQWVIQSKCLPPMSVDALLNQASLEDEVAVAFAMVRGRKMSCSEQEPADRVPVLDRWIERTLQEAPERCESLPAGYARTGHADRAFMKILHLPRRDPDAWR